MILSRKIVERPLMAHQEQALEYALKRDHPAFFMEMRLGKTLTTIRYARELGLRTCVVVAPLTVLHAWQRELSLEREEFVNAYGLSTDQFYEAVRYVHEAPSNGHRRWLLFNYEALLSHAAARTFRSRGKEHKEYDVPLVANMPWNLVVLDESTRIKNPDAHITRACTDGWRNVEHRVILTGLPTPEGELDIYSQFQFQTGRFLGCSNVWQFRHKHFVKGHFGTGWEPTAEGYRLIKSATHKRAFILRAADTGMGHRFIPERRVVTMTEEQKRVYRRIAREWAYDATVAADRERLGVGDRMTEYGDGGVETVETDLAPVKYLWLRRVAGGYTPDLKRIGNAKSREILELLRGELGGRRQCVVWFAFVTELEGVRGDLRVAGISSVVVHGGIPMHARSKALDRFQRGASRVLLATEDCAQYGIDASAADCAVYYSNSLSNTARQQSQMRIVHPQKRRPLLIVDLVSEDTLDEDIVDTMQDKSVRSTVFMMKLDSNILRGLGRWA